MNSQSPRRPLSPDKLGEKGESRFKELCTDAGLIANKASIDVMGWDYLIEFPYPAPDTAMPLDKRVHPPECKVQVKTVWDHTKHVNLKLSAAERLAKVDRPSFIVVLSVSARLDVMTMHIFHMLDQHLEHVLRRLREATAQDSLKINHAEIAFSLRNGVSLTPDGASLRHFITDACGGSTHAYRDKKADQVSNLGFGNLRFTGNFTVKMKDESDLAELFLGLRTAELITFEANETRFGIKLPSHAQGGGTIKIIPQPAAKCKIFVKGHDNSPTVIIPATLYLPPKRNQNGNRPFRISGSLFDIFVNGNELKVDNKPTDFAKTLIATKEMLATLKFHKLVARGGGQFTVFVKGKEFFIGEFDSTVDQKLLQHTEMRIRLVEMMSTIFKATDTQSRPVSLSSMVDNSVDLQFLNGLLQNEEIVPVTQTTFQPDGNFELPPPSEALFIKQIRFPDFAIAFYAVIDVMLTKRPPDVVIDIVSMSLRDIKVIEASDDDFDIYSEEARLTTGIAMCLIMRPA